MFEDLYKDIGKKIKGLVKWIFAVEAAGMIIAGLVMLFDYAPIAGMVFLIVGPLVAWISSWLLYAFGELVDKTAENEANTRNILKILKEKDMPQVQTAAPQAQAAAPKAQTAVPQAQAVQPQAQAREAYLNEMQANHSWRCDGCGKMATQSPCEHCGYGQSAADAPYWCGKCGHLGPYEDKCPQCGSSIRVFNVKK